jgi:hypothetical protein
MRIVLSEGCLNFDHIIEKDLEIFVCWLNLIKLYFKLTTKEKKITK